jgi:hypothetical protein
MSGMVQQIAKKLQQGQVEGTCECGNEHLGSIKCWEVVD